jgi:hypothetical protein
MKLQVRLLSKKRPKTFVRFKIVPVTLGDNLTETDGNDGGREEEEEEEVPDNLTLDDKTLGLQVEGINKFQNNLLEFCSFSSKQLSETNSLFLI